MSKDYLDKYREKEKSSKPKKSKTKKFQGAGLKIVDTDEGLGPVAAPSFLKKKDPKRVLDHVEDEANPLDPDEMPQVVSVLDERPLEIRLAEEFSKANKWRAVAADNEGRKSGNKRNSDSDQSPRGGRTRKGSDSDVSPPRERKRAEGKRRGGSDSDCSPPRKREGGSSRPRVGERDSDASPPRRRKEVSPVRRRRDEDISTPRRRRKGSEDASPPRRKRKGSEDASPPRRKRRDSDASPPRRGGDRERRREKDSRRDLSPRRRRGQDDDISPPRPNRGRISDERMESSRRRGSDSDNSPVRRRKDSPLRNTNRRSPGPSSAARRRGSRSPEPSQRMTQTLDGKKAGLQTAGALKDELNAVKQQEKERFEKMDAAVSGRYAKTKFRDRETGKLRDLDAELEQKLEEEKKLAERKAQYDKWGKGVKQAEEQQERVESALHEMAKPLARYKDDEDLDAHLKSIEREGDPMLKFLAKKKAKAAGGPSKPVYQGPPPPPNRFGILPGYRWDGVDRSSGYEKEWFQKINSKKAFQEESYKWSVEDL